MAFTKHHDLIVVGVGSGNTIVSDALSDLDVAIVANGPFGGTCLNAGYIPSKMPAHTAELAGHIQDAARFRARC